MCKNQRIVLATLLIIVIPSARLFSTDQQKKPGNLEFFVNNKLKYNFPQSVNKLDAEAIGLMGQEKWQEAIQKLNLSIEKMPNNPRALANRAVCYQSLGKLDEAIRDYDKSLSIAPEIKAPIDSGFGDALLKRGRRWVDQGELNRAEEDFNKAQEFDSVKAPAMSELAYLASTRQNYDQCVSWAEKANKSDKDFTDAWVTKGACLSGSGHLKEALESLNQAIKLDSSLTAAYLNRAAVYAALHDCDAAKADAYTVVKLDTNLMAQADQMIAACK